MDKKTKKEFKKLDKEVKDLHKTTIQVNNRFQKIMGLKNEEGGEESDEENEELDDYLNNVNEEEVSAILQKAEQEMKEEEEEKKRQEKENEENKDKMEKMLKEELENISDEEKNEKKKKKQKKKKERNNSDENDENNDNKNDEESYKEFIEFQKWKKMKELQKEKQKEEENNNNFKQKEKDENENNNNKNNKKEINDIKSSKKENKEKEIKKEEKKEEQNKEIKQENNDDNKEETKEKEFDFNINNINNNDNMNNQNLNNNNNNNDDYNNLDNNNNNNNNNIQQNNKPEQIIPKNVYDKISANDKKFVADLLRACNAKFQEGEAFASMGKYSDALKCYSVAKNLFMKSNKVIQSKKNVYPKEFMMKITSIISDKLKLVHQAAKNCSNAMKEKIINKANLRNNNNFENNNFNNNNTNNNNNLNNNIDNNKDINNEINNNNTKINNNKPNLDKNEDKNINNYNFDFNELNNNNKNNNNNKIRNQNTFNNNNNNNNNQNNKPKSLHDKEEDAMDEKILSEIMTKNPGVKFSDIIGMNDMKQTLYEIIVVPQIRPDLFTGIRTPQRGILLFGPPGTGKTMIAKAIASECGSTFFNISASSLTSKWVGESEKTVKSLFKIAYQKVPSIIFIDEIDSILSKRSESENEATKRLKTEFLIQFDGLGSNTSARLLVIAATNRPMDLDEALLRRLPKRVYCGPLDEDGRFEFIKKVINRVETDLSDEDIKEIAKMTNDYSNSDLMELCREAAYRPVRELTNDEILKLDKFRPINKKDLLDAVHKIRGTLSKKVKEDLRKWNEQFGGV